MAELEFKGSDRISGLAVGAGLLAVTLVVPPPADMPLAAWRVAGISLLMATLWITEALPIPATALVPLVLFPLLGIAPMGATAAPYADPIIFLFLGGFIIGAGMQRWDLHRRIGLHAIALMGTTPRRLVGGFMLSTALLSMWISNSATAIMMLPVAASVLALLDRNQTPAGAPRDNLGIVLMLAVAYGASIGGLGTLIGTPPNALLAAYMAREHGVTIGFAEWMALGLPLVAVMLAGAWLILIRLYPLEQTGGGEARSAVQAELEKLGAMTRAERRVAAVFGLTALAWVTRPLYAGVVPAINDTVIAIAGALMLFVLPSGMPDARRLVVWDDLKALPWGVLILFGGGLSLASAINASGLAAWLGAAMAVLADWPVLLIVSAATLAMIFLTELTSNTASAATFLPIGGALAVGIGLDPLALTVPLALAASCAFMLPVATPPNAIVFSSGRITVSQMARAGLWVNLFGSVAIVAIASPLAGWLFGE
ncbi:MAG: DASS family sodium-coupled anion symporter [Blastochloris sp.]|nr:DASS family sodium-coupled anion symporter [Blastochloris sp.]